MGTSWDEEQSQYVTATKRAFSRPILRYAVALFFVVALAVYMLNPMNLSQINRLRPATDISTSLPQAPTIAVVSMLYGARNTLYERALKSHERHAALQGLPIHILRNNVANGFWNKPSYILSILVAELAKDPPQQATWLMWVDGDSIIIDPQLRSDMFLPPPDFEYINYLVAKDQNGMNTGIFFLRVCDWSVKFMAKALAYPLFRLEDDLGRSADQEAMARVANETEFRTAILYQPRIWYNTYEFRHAYEGEPGRLLVHFPGLEEDRWTHMEKWLDIVEGPKASEWQIPLVETAYPSEITQFWAELREAKKALRAAEWWMMNKEEVPEKLTLASAKMMDVVHYSTDNVEAVTEATTRLNEALESARTQ